MEREFLKSKVRELLPEEYEGWMGCLLSEALRARDGMAVSQRQHLGAKALVRRRARLWTGGCTGLALWAEGSKGIPTSSAH